MRYIPMSSYSFEEICEQCQNAINRAPEVAHDSQDLYSEVRKFYRYDEALETQSYFRMKDYGSLVK